MTRGEVAIGCQTGMPFEFENWKYQKPTKKPFQI